MRQLVARALGRLRRTDPVRRPCRPRVSRRPADALRNRGRRGGGADAPRFRIGINSGPALVGNIGSEKFRNFTAIGDTMNVAQRVQSSAEPGQTIVGPATANALGTDASLTPIPPLRVKGREQPVQSYLLG